MLDPCLSRNVPSPDVVNTIEIRMYHMASMRAAVDPIKIISGTLYSELTKWLNIATKKSAIFGLKIDIKNPSLAPFKSFLELLVW